MKNFHVKSIEPPDSHFLSAAQGWLGLGNYSEAAAESGRISPNLSTHPEVMELRWQLLEHAGRWEECVEIGKASVTAHPNLAQGWIHRSYALHELKRTQEAYENLLPAYGSFPEVWTIPYNLACYCAQLGKLDEARKWLRRAAAIDKKAVRLAGADDPDLKPLRGIINTDVED